MQQPTRPAISSDRQSATGRAGQRIPSSSINRHCLDLPGHVSTRLNASRLASAPASPPSIAPQLSARPLDGAAPTTRPRRHDPPIAETHVTSAARHSVMFVALGHAHRPFERRHLRNGTSARSIGGQQSILNNLARVLAGKMKRAPRSMRRRALLMKPLFSLLGADRSTRQVGAGLARDASTPAKLSVT